MSFSNFKTMDEWDMKHEFAVHRAAQPIPIREGVTPSEIEYLSQRAKDEIVDAHNAAIIEPTLTSVNSKHQGKSPKKSSLGFPKLEPTSPVMSPTIVSPTIISPEDLFKRDNQAISYARSRLLDGDTLVVVKYPSMYPICDATGFILDTTFRVHSHKLLATGSRVFTKMLSEENQLKYRQRPLFKEMNIPDDVHFVLDLTPATDDNEALELVTSLSCPKGILYWSASRSRLGIPQRFVCGEDERVLGQLEPTRLSGPTIVHDANSGPTAVDFNGNVYNKSTHKASGEGYFYGQDLQEATERSLKENGGDTPIEPIITLPTSTKQLPADYCGIRHCAGIERMLQLIEGKDARLDSAPKVWTVAMLAGFFDCTGAVVDAICTWVMSQSNGIIIEILPEACLRLGLVLRSELITRAAFAVLVSEEALCIGGQRNNVPSKRDATTPFDRIRDDLDDDILNMVQHAGRSFFDRIDEKVKDLLDEDMAWLETLPEYSKIRSFKNSIRGVKGSEVALRSIATLQDRIAHYVRGRLFYCLLRQLQPEQVNGMHARRSSERYISNIPINVRDLYDGFESQQRVMTRQFWEMVRTVGWSASHGCSNLLYQNLEYDNPHYKANTNINVASHFHIKKTLMEDIFKAANEFNLDLFDHKTQLDPIPHPKPSFTLTNLSDSEIWNPPTFAERHRRVIHFAARYEGEMKLGYNTDSTYHRACEYDQMVHGYAVPPHSEYFELIKFMDQVRKYVSATCDAMLNRGEHSSFTLPETLVCLTDAEYKYLPLFAGGFEDGSGGVYQDELPPALAGPSGPGPSYHTGLSIASTGTAGSEGTVDWDEVSRGAGTESTVDGWSRDVDDGFTDHLDRRRIGSEISFGSQAFSELGVESEDGFEKMDVEEYSGKGKGKAVETHTGKGKEVESYMNKGKGKEIDHSVGNSMVEKPVSALDSLMSDDFFTEEDYPEVDDFNSGDEDGFDFMDDSDNDTATEKGEDDDHDM